MFDKISDHLIVIDNTIKKGNNIIGTYRLLRADNSKNFDGLYTEREFDISRIKKMYPSKSILELGRSCIHKKYRSGIILKLFRKRIGNYTKNYKIKVLIGCLSFHTTDHRNIIEKLFFKEKCSLKKSLKVSSLQKTHYKYLSKINKNSKVDNIFNSLSPLIKGYLRAGGLVSDEFYIDHDFETIDLCIVMFTNNIDSRYYDKFLN